MAGDDDLDWINDYVLSVLKSPTWVNPIAQFVDDHCFIFDAEEENKFEYTTYHQQFKQLIDDLLAAHLLEVSVTPEQFEGFLERGLAGSDLHHILVEQLLSVDDFITFKGMMVKRNADLNREAVSMLLAGGESVLDTSGVSSLDGSEEAATAAALAAAAVAQATAAAGAEIVSDDWRLYEDQIFEAMASSEDDERREAELKCEEAELAQAIALSLQLEEERLRTIANDEALQLRADDGAIDEFHSPGAPLASWTPPIRVGHISSPLVPLPPSMPPQAAEPVLSAPLTLRPVVPKVMRMQPFNAPREPDSPKQAKASAEPVDQMQFERMRAEAILRRERAERVIATPVAAAPIPAVAIGPSQAERQARAEHLRKQRDLLLQKRTKEREQQNAQFQRTPGTRAASALDRGGMSSGDQAAVGRSVVAELSPGAVAASHSAPPLPDTGVAAERMRQALTLQLRQTLARSDQSTADVLGDGLNRLERMRHR